MKKMLSTRIFHHKFSKKLNESIHIHLNIQIQLQECTGRVILVNIVSLCIKSREKKSKENLTLLIGENIGDLET